MKTIRNCPFDPSDIEMLLLKLTVRAAILSNNAVGYKDKILLLPPTHQDADTFSLFRRSEPASAIFVPHRRAAEAVDRFIASFVYEQDCNMNDVLFYQDAQADSGARTWEHIKTHILGIQSLISVSDFSTVLTK